MTQRTAGRVFIEFPWAADTAQNPDRWNPQNPASGHCAVASLVAQDIFGGELWRVEVGGQSHYFNRLPGGALLDVTSQQFDKAIDYRGAKQRSREYVLSYQATARRYELLKSRMKRFSS